MDRAQESKAGRGSRSRELIDAMLPFILMLDDAHVATCRLEERVEPRKARAIKDYPSLRWYVLVAPAPNTAVAYADPVLRAIEDWIESIGRRPGGAPKLKITEGKPLGDARMARHLRSWLKQPFDWRPARVTVQPLAGGRTRVCVYPREGNRRPAALVLKPSNMVSDDRGLYVRAGYFLHRELDDLCDRSDYVSSAYRVDSRQGDLDEIALSIMCLRLCADCLVRSRSPLDEGLSEAGRDALLSWKAFAAGEESTGKSGSMPRLSDHPQDSQADRR